MYNLHPVTMAIGELIVLMAKLCFIIMFMAARRDFLNKPDYLS